MKEFVKRKLENIQRLDDEKILQSIESAADVLQDALKNNNKILVCGNGGSAADSQHFAAELVGRFKHERAALPAIALHTNTSTLTAVANDYDYTSVFSRQVEAFGHKGDVFIGISTSGKAQNILKAVESSKKKGLTTIAVTGQSADNPLVKITNLSICVPGDNTADIQECHIMVLHLLCEVIDNAYAPNN
jgi:D-sedoheptulose 7-phosphate isomerase